MTRAPLSPQSDPTFEGQKFEIFPLGADGAGFAVHYEGSEAEQYAAMFDRVKYPPWGVHGGKEGASGRITVLKKSGEKETLYKSKAYPLEPGDSIIVETGGGGGYGPPSQRPRDLVERDLRRGYISEEAAARDYARN